MYIFDLKNLEYFLTPNSQRGLFLLTQRETIDCPLLNSSVSIHSFIKAAFSYLSLFQVFFSHKPLPKCNSQVSPQSEQSLPYALILMVNRRENLPWKKMDCCSWNIPHWHVLLFVTEVEFICEVSVCINQCHRREKENNKSLLPPVSFRWHWSLYFQ